MLFQIKPFTESYWAKCLNVLLCLFPGSHNFIIFGLQQVQLAQYCFFGCQGPILYRTGIMRLKKTNKKKFFMGLN